jgi:maltoporin
LRNREEAVVSSSRARARRAAGWIAAASLCAAPAAAAEAPAFQFGGYGRVGLSSDLDGGRGRPTRIVPWGPRLAEEGYLELDFGARLFREADTPTATRVRALVTLAVAEPFFHDDAQFELNAAVRQALVEAENVVVPGDFVWVGSRMVRGDDLYLFDFWPMDDLNTVGAGLGHRGASTEVSGLVGLSRPESLYAVQRVPVPSPVLGATEVEVLDRQRTIAALRGEQRFGGGPGELGLKLRLYGELHHLPSGTRRDPDDPANPDATQPVPDDLGWVAGVQGGLWGFGRNAHLNVFLRYAGGLAAYGAHDTPRGLNDDRRALGATELRAAFSGNYETADFGVMSAGWVRSFTDADDETEDFDDRVEGALAVRPMLFLGRYFTPGVEASFQVSRANGLNPRTLTQDLATVTQLAVLPALTFGDAPVGTYTRPQLRAIYAVSLLNDAALALYPEDDPRAQESVVHYVGFAAEWWFGRDGGY